MILLIINTKENDIQQSINITNIVFRYEGLYIT